MSVGIRHARDLQGVTPRDRPRENLLPTVWVDAGERRSEKREGGE